jgi:hypothetical protein
VPHALCRRSLFASLAGLHNNVTVVCTLRSVNAGGAPLFRHHLPRSPSVALRGMLSVLRNVSAVLLVWLAVLTRCRLPFTRSLRILPSFLLIVSACPGVAGTGAESLPSNPVTPQPGLLPVSSTGALLFIVLWLGSGAFARYHNVCPRASEQPSFPLMLWLLGCEIRRFVR